MNAMARKSIAVGIYCVLSLSGQAGMEVRLYLAQVTERTMAGEKSKNPWRVESVLLEGNLDSDVKKDYVVNESDLLPRTGCIDEGCRSYRVAVYLNVPLSSRQPAWSSDWRESDGDPAVEKLSPLPGLTILRIDHSEGDASWTHVVLLDGGKAHEEISHQLDYGWGEMKVTRLAGGKVVLEVPVSHLKFRGETMDKPSAQTKISCKNPRLELPGLRFVFQAKERRFVLEKAICISVPSDTQGHKVESKN